MDKAPMKPAAVPTPMTRPFEKDADGCFRVPGDAMNPYMHANYDNNNQDSAKVAPPRGTNPMSFVSHPEGKPSA